MRAMIGLAALVVLLGTAVAARGANEEIEIQFPAPKAFLVLDEAEGQLARLAGEGNAAAGALRQEIPPLRGKLQALKNAADGFLSRELRESDHAAVAAHNAECDRVLEAEIRPFVARSQALLQRAGLQVPSLMREMAAALVDSGVFDADEDGTTHCNEFLDAFATITYGYAGFQGKKANGIVEQLRQQPAEWKSIHDPAKGSGERESLQERLGAAQRYANNGYLVVIGQKSGAADQSGGHVAVVMPGELAESGKWAEAGMPKLLPQIAQAGTSTFAGKHLGYGFTPVAAGSQDFVIYYRKP